MPINAFSNPYLPGQPNPKIYFDSAAPTQAGVFAVGDIVINDQFAAGRPIGWICQDAAAPVFVPLFVPGMLGGAPLNLTAAGVVPGTPAVITVSGFAGNVTLGSPVSYGTGTLLSITPRSTHAVTLVAPSGTAIVGFNPAVANTAVGALLLANGTNWFRVS